MAARGISILTSLSAVRIANFSASSSVTNCPCRGDPEDSPERVFPGSLADVFDALTTERPYKKAWPVDEAEALIESEGGKHCDPNIVALFVKIIPKFLEIKMKFAENNWPDSYQPI